MNKTVLISGGGVGIGSAVAEKFAMMDYNVAISYFKSEYEANLLRENLSKQNKICKIYKADARSSREMQILFETVNKDFGSIDVVVANSGISCFRQIQDCTDRDYEDVLGTNFKGVFHMFKFASTLMIEQKRGKMIAISSVFGESGASCESLYSASKGAVNAFVKSLAKELAPSNICVNAISCGLIDTKMNSRLSELEKKELICQIPLGRMGKPSEVAQLAYFLASEKSDYITGEVISIAGGW